MAKARAENGQFAKGWAGGPGRPKKATETKYLKALVGQVPLKEWRLVVKRALHDAKGGDAAARAWLSKHLVGDDPLTFAALLEDVADLREQLLRLYEYDVSDAPPDGEPDARDFGGPDAVNGSAPAAGRNGTPATPGSPPASEGSPEGS
jgi:hypothetical protein